MNLTCVVLIKNSEDIGTPHEGKYIIARKRTHLNDLNPHKELLELMRVLPNIEIILSVMKPVIVNDKLLLHSPKRLIRIFDNRDNEKHWIDMPYSRILCYTDIFSFMNYFWTSFPYYETIKLISTSGAIRHLSDRLDSTVASIQVDNTSIRLY